MIYDSGGRWGDDECRAVWKICGLKNLIIGDELHLRGFRTLQSGKKVGRGYSSKQAQTYTSVVVDT